MYKNKKIAIVVPAYNEETQIEKVLNSMPEFVDSIIVVDDASTDNTREIIGRYTKKPDGKVSLLALEKNSGVGGAIAAGYHVALENGCDVAVVMAGDGQMNPEELPGLLDPVVSGEVDYTKGNRLITGDAWQRIPLVRLLGNAALSVLTKIASGYWHVADSQNGYTAINSRALKILLQDGFYARYGMPNDVLVKLNVHGFVVRDIPMAAEYGVGETSKMNIPKIVVPLAMLLIKLFFHRMWHKYVVRDTHPLVLFYAIGMALVPLGVLYGALIVWVRLISEQVQLLAGITQAFRPICTESGIILDVLVTLAGLQMLLFAMWFDMQHNSRLR